MNFTQSFEEFSRGLGRTDLILYAGIGLLVWVMFKDKLSPVQNLLQGVLDNVKKLFINTTTKPQTSISVSDAVLAKAIEENSIVVSEPEDYFFKLIVSWKETRDLAVRCGCSKAVEVADAMFPYLSPNICGKETKNAQL